MIPRQVIDQIINTARIEEVIGEYVTLKRSGQNYKALSPFVDEKTPSFMVSPAKQIFKDFSSGKGGNVVSFLMELEQFSYPEALRFLAKKYNIELPEVEEDPEYREKLNEQESLYIILDVAQKYFENQLHKTDEGNAIGLSYFKERGFSTETITKFRLGYSSESWDAFANYAKEKGYKQEYLELLGLLKKGNEKIYDVYRGRVIFPIHNLSGRVIGFGARTLKSDKKVPKYINSPESAVYNKSASLYGVFYAKGEMVKQDNCYLVEGYTDVISMHQSGIANVVASSGTSLTEGQIKLIKRYTQNITILYDGDSAGIKASFRGIDMILQEGMNVRVVLFPDGEDPDSFSRKSSKEELQEFLNQNQKDFIGFKTDILLEEANKDPIKKASLLKEIVQSIALIPDHITRTVYIQDCGRRMEIAENVLMNELNKLLRQKIRNDRSSAVQNELQEGTINNLIAPNQDEEKQIQETSIYFQERDLLRIILNYGTKSFSMPVFVEAQEGEKAHEEIQEFEVAYYILSDILHENIVFREPLHQKLLEFLVNQYDTFETIKPELLTNSEDAEVSNLVTELVMDRYTLHDWEKQKIYVKSEEHKLRKAVIDSLYAFKIRHIQMLIAENNKLLKEFVPNEENTEAMMSLLGEKKQLNEVKMTISKKMGRVIIK